MILLSKIINPPLISLLRGFTFSFMYTAFEPKFTIALIRPFFPLKIFILGFIGVGVQFYFIAGNILMPSTSHQGIVGNRC